MQSSNKIDIYVNSVCKKIRNWKARKTVCEELKDHIIDARDSFIAQGFDESTATEKAITETGKADFIGSQLNKAHRPDPGRNMRFSLTLKTMLRSPLRTLFMFLLIAAASFALFSRVTDYAVTSREIEAVLSNYRGVVALNNCIPDTSGLSYRESILPNTPQYNHGWINLNQKPIFLTNEMIETISTLPGVTLAEIRYMTGGVIRDYERFYRHEDLYFGYNYNARYIIEGTLSGIAFIENPNIGEGHGFYDLYFEDSKVLVGNYPLKEVQNRWTEGLPDGVSRMIDLPVPENYYNYSGDIFRVSGRTFDVSGYVGIPEVAHDPDLGYCYHIDPYLYDFDFLESLEVGKRYVFIGRYSELLPSVTYLGECETHDYFTFEEVTELERNVEMSARLQNLINITEKDLHTFDIVYTSDMRAIPRVNEQTMVLHEGRFLTQEDEKNNAQVCVVSQVFFEKNNLKLGDTLTVELGDKLFMQHAGMGAISYIPERQWNTVKTVELEIVGVYMDTNSPYQRSAELYWDYHPCTLFVPKSLLPIEVPADHEIWAGEFSVLIENPYDLDAFWAIAPKATDWVTELFWDYTLPDWQSPDKLKRYNDSQLVAAKWRYSDGGWSRVKDSINTSTTTSLVTTVSFAAGAGLALLLAVYLYIGRNKQNFAIMRALGTPRKKAGYALGFPFVILALLAIPLGGITGLVYTSRTVTPMLEELAENVGKYTANTALPVEIITLCLLSMLLFIVLLFALFLRSMGKKPVLELLQGDVIRVRDIKELSGEIAQLDTFDFGEIPKRGQYSAFRHVSRYILRHIGRVKWRTAISLILAVVLSGAIGFLALTRLFYKDLFNEVTVTATTANFSTSTIDELYNSELTENVYYISDYVIFYEDITEFAYPLTITNDFERSMEEAFGGDYVIEYADGYSDTDFFATDNADNLCVIGSNFGAKPGDIVTVKGGDYIKEQGSISLKVIAVISPQNPADKRDIADRIYAPLSADVMHLNNNNPFAISYSDFTLTDNERAAEFTAFLDELRTDSQLISVTAEYNAELTELDNIKSVRDLLVLLFPIAVLGAVLIGLTAPMLLILQSSKEAAILRVLGTTKRRVRCMLMFEQIGLCVIGLVLAAGGLIIYNSGLFTKSADTLLICGALYLLGCVFAAFAASVSVSKNKILELLQVKE